jgi:hypothetical protein
LPAFGAQFAFLTLWQFAADLIGHLIVEGRQQLVHFAVTLRALHFVVSREDQFFKSMTTLFASVFVEGHENLLSAMNERD